AQHEEESRQRAANPDGSLFAFKQHEQQAHEQLERASLAARQMAPDLPVVQRDRYSSIDNRGDLERATPDRQERDRKNERRRQNDRKHDRTSDLRRWLCAAEAGLPQMNQARKRHAEIAGIRHDGRPSEIGEQSRRHEQTPGADREQRSKENERRSLPAGARRAAIALGTPVPPAVRQNERDDQNDARL